MSYKCRRLTPQVKWARENYPHDHKNVAYHLRLASADSKGLIIVWDVVSGLERCSFNEPNRTVADFCWLPWQDSSRDFLLALHPAYSIVLWNADTGEKVWKKSYTDSLISFTLNPFRLSRLAFLTQSGNLMLIDDFSVSKVPSSNGQLYKISSLTASASGSLSNVSVASTDEVRRGQHAGMLLSGAARFIRKPLIQVFPAHRGTKQDDMNGPEDNYPCLQIGYHPAVRHLMILVYSREVLFLETQFMQTVAHVVLDRVMSPFVQVLPSSQRDAVFFVQENGCITLRIQKCRPSVQEPHNLEDMNFTLDVYNPLEVIYEGIASSESLRVTKAYRLFGAAICPLTQCKVALLMSNGRILLYDLAKQSDVGVTNHSSLGRLISVDRDLNSRSKARLRFVLSGMLSSLGQNPSVVRARPVVIMGECVSGTRAGLMESDSADQHSNTELIAVGTSDGTVQLVTVNSGEIKKEFSVHSCPIKCMDWGGINHVITCGYAQTLSTSTVVRNELFSTDIRTGLTKPIRPEVDESPIDMLRVSYYQKPQQTIYRENLVVLDNENHLYHVVVKGMHVKDGKEVNTQWATTSQVNAMVWKDDYLAFGDNEGKISVWDLGSKQSKASSMQRGGVQRLQFSRTPTDYTLIVLHSDGVSLWNAATFTQLHEITVSKDMYGKKVLDVDITGETSVPVVLTNDGCLRVFDHSLSLQTAPVPHNILHSTFSPCLLPPASAVVLKTLLTDARLRSLYSEGKAIKEAISNTELSTSERELLIKQIQCLDIEELSDLISEKPLWEQVVGICRLMGDEWGSKLWTTISYNFAARDKQELPHVNPCFDFLWPNQTFRRIELRKCACFDSRRATSEQLNVQVGALIGLKQLDPAVQLLLDTDNTSPEYYADCLKACLLSAVHSSSACQSTVKLVATNLIATEKLFEGTQLLCLIDKSLDACRYLQSNGEWEKAAWLAKVCLNDTDCHEILRKWADHLAGPNVCLKSMAMLVLVSLSDWERTLEFLVSMKQIGSAVLLLEVLNNFESYSNNSLSESIYAEYARELLDAGLSKAARYYVQFAGERGANILKEIDILVSDQ